MTRINCVPVQELTDKHLLAEYREMPRVSALARCLDDVPAVYLLGKGHVKFFYDKGEFLRRRFEDEIVPEMQRRGFVTRFTKYRPHPDGLNNDWQPDEQALTINRKRIAQRLSERKTWPKEIQNHSAPTSSPA